MLPRWLDDSPHSPPLLAPSSAPADEAGEAVWKIERDVLRGTTCWITEFESTWSGAYDATVSEHRSGRVMVDTTTLITPTCTIVNPVLFTSGHSEDP